VVENPVALTCLTKPMLVRSSMESVARYSAADLVGWMP
jgi:hypothetical protein